MTTILTAQFAVGAALILSGTPEIGYEIFGLGSPSFVYGNFEDAFEDFGGYVVARTQENVGTIATS
jgi:hypothetical protein